MKKIIFTSLIAIISLSTFAQGKSGKNKGHQQNGTYQKHKNHNDDDDRYEDRDKKDKEYKKDDRYNDQDGRDRRDRDQNNGNRNKYSCYVTRCLQNAANTQPFFNARFSKSKLIK